jgi:CBS domain-containing protein
MKVKDVMTRKVLTVKSDETLIEAARILVKHNVSGAPVVDKKGKMIGVLSEKDLFHALYPDVKDILRDLRLWLGEEKIKHRVAAKRNIPVSQLMSKKIITVGEDEEVLKVGSIMLEDRIHRLPVVKNKKLVGIVSRRDIFRKLLKNDLKI